MTVYEKEVTTCMYEFSDIIYMPLQLSLFDTESMIQENWFPTLQKQVESYWSAISVL